MIKPDVRALLHSGHVHIQNVMDVTTFLRTLTGLLIFLFAFLGLCFIFLKDIDHPKISGRVLTILPVKTAPLVDNSASQQNLPQTDAAPDFSTIKDVVAGLTEETPQGLLPITRKDDGFTPYEAYKAPFVLKKNTRGVIAIIVTDFGLSDDLAEQMIESLPSGLTFAASPYAGSLQHKISEARKSGKEIWLAPPIQGTSYPEHDTGPLTILTGLNREQTLARLHESLGKVTGYAGIAFTTAPSFPSQSMELSALVGDIQARGLALAQLDSKDTVMDAIVKDKKGLLYFHTTQTLSPIKGKEFLLSELMQLEETALGNGYTVAVLPAVPMIIKTIEAWSKTLSNKNIQLAPLSYAIHQHSLMTPH